MPGERLRHGEDAAAGAKPDAPTGASGGKGGEAAIDGGEAGNGPFAVASRQRRERFIEIAVQPEPEGDVLQPENIGTHRERREKSGAL